MIDVTVKEGRIENRIILVERADAGHRVVMERNDARRDLFGLLLQSTELRRREHTDGDGTFAELLDLAREKVGLLARHTARRIHVRVTQRHGLRQTPAARDQQCHSYGQILFHFTLRVKLLMKNSETWKKRRLVCRSSVLSDLRAANHLPDQASRRSRASATVAISNPAASSSLRNAATSSWLLAASLPLH